MVKNLRIVGYSTDYIINKAVVDVEVYTENEGILETTFIGKVVVGGDTVDIGSNEALFETVKAKLITNNKL